MHREERNLLCSSRSPATSWGSSMSWASSRCLQPRRSGLAFLRPSNRSAILCHGLGFEQKTRVTGPLNSHLCLIYNHIQTLHSISQLPGRRNLTCVVTTHRVSRGSNVAPMGQARIRARFDLYDPHFEEFHPIQGAAGICLHGEHSVHNLPV